MGMKTPPPKVFTFLILSLPPGYEGNGIKVSTLQMRRWHLGGASMFNLPVSKRQSWNWIPIASDYTACVLIIMFH